jgi:4-amino-4-deoxy-L-arabinose transferase-like glycosyltransferase
VPAEPGAFDRHPLLEAAMVAAVLVLAAYLRFTAIAWGLSHPAEIDERYFVENVALMLHHGDLDPRFYEYPGLFFYLLYPLLWLEGVGFPTGPEAYVAARSLGAGASVAAVGVLYLLGRKLAGPRAALAGALLLAVSPLHAQHTHRVRPDMTLEPLVLLALLAFRRAGTGPAADAGCGAALGAAVALKYTGVLLAPSYLAAHLLGPRRSWKGLALAALAAGVVFAAASPYTFLRFAESVDSLGAHTEHAYGEADTRGPLPSLVGYSRAWPRALGWAGVALAAAGAVAIRRRWRGWLPLVLLPLCALALFGTSTLVYLRHMIPSLGVLALLAGVAVETAWRFRPAAGALLLAVAAAWPLSSSLEYLQAIQRPTTRERLAAWLRAEVPPGSVILSSLDDFDGGRQVEVLKVDRLGADNRLQALEADFVVRTRKDAPEAFTELIRIERLEPDNPFVGPPLEVWTADSRCRPRWTRIDLSSAAVSSSANPKDVEHIRADPSPETEDAARVGDWVRVVLPRPALLGRIELVPGTAWRRSARRPRVKIHRDGRWDWVHAWPGRPHMRDQVGSRTQVLLIEPVETDGVKLVQAAPTNRRWSIGEVRLEAPDPAAGGCRPGG